MKRISNIIRAVITLSISYLILPCCTVKEVEDVYSGFPYIELEAQDISFPKTAQTVEIPIKTNRSLIFKTSSSNDEWLNVSLSEDGSHLQITASANPLETSRTASISIKTPNGLVSKELKVFQDPSGELTIKGDLILKSHQEILSNTYTKTMRALILGNVSNVSTKSSEEIWCGDYIITASESDIKDESVDTITRRINAVDGKTLIIAKTQVTGFPLPLIQKHDIKKVYLPHNSISAIPSDIKNLGLSELSLRGNSIGELSSLEGCTTLTDLDISYNDIYTLDPLKSLTNLKSLDVSGLPLSVAQLEVFAEEFSGCEVKSLDMRPELSKFPVMDIAKVDLTSATMASMTTEVLHNNGGTIKEAGFYIGKGENIAGMTKYVGTYSSSANTISLTYDNTKEFSDELYFRSYAVNETGTGYGPRSRLGDPHAKGDVYLTSDAELSAFYNDNYLYVEGVLVVGASSTNGDVSNGDVRLPLDGQKYLKPSDITDITKLSKLQEIKDGLFIANTKVEDFSVLSDIQSVPVMWLTANRMVSIPYLNNVKGLKELNLSRNKINDFTPLLGLPELETLYLGYSETLDLETNDIGTLAGLEGMSNLKYLDLSGLPLIQKQVNDLQKLLPNCKIVFNAADRPAYLPTVRTDGFNIGGGSVTLVSTLVYSGKTNVTEFGFYIGKDLAAMEKVQVGTSIADGTTFSYKFITDDRSDFYFYPYAINSIGEGTDVVYKKFNINGSDLSQYETSNCYIVPEAGTYMFNASVKGNGNDPVGSISSVEVIWETKGPHDKANPGEVIRDLRLSGQNIIFTSTGLEGNALIAAKNSSGTILWSWHIWCTDIPVDHKYVNSKGTFLVQDRHLGAIRGDRGTGDQWKESVGFEYQWGRKDPLVGGIMTSSNVKNCTLETTVQNPTVVYTKRVPEDNLWLTDRKTIYDPCPVGYHVAPLDIWADFRITKTYGSFDNGWYFYYNDTEYAWYPVKGRGTETGYDYWMDSYMTSSSPNNKGFYFSSYTVNANYNWSAEGYDQLRCMRTTLINVNIATTDITGVTTSSAIVSGNVKYTGKVNLTEQGFSYCTDQNAPDETWTKVTVPITEGVFTKTLTGLKTGTTYYVRSYVVENGVAAYGNIISFMTLMPGGAEGLPEEDYEW